MLKKLVLGLTLISIFALTSCSEEDHNVEVVVSSSPFLLIPASISSCYSQLSAVGETPTRDVEASFFEVPRIGIVRKDASKTLYIASIRLTVEVPYGEPVVCNFGGEYLAALDKDNWYMSPTREAIVPASQDKYATTCAARCGGFQDKVSYVAPGVIEVRGYEVGSDGQQYPVKIESSFSVESY